MKNKKDVLIIDNDVEFVNKIEELLRYKINIISAEDVETALTYGKYNKILKDSQARISPDLIIIGDVCKPDANLQEKLKEEFPKIYKERLLQTFLPVFYSDLFQNVFQTNFTKKPKACICADLEKYPFNGSEQDITKKLGYCMQYNIPLMYRHERNKDLILTLLENHICKKCGIENDKSYR